MSLPILRESADTVRFFDDVTGEEIHLPDAPTDVVAELRHRIRDTEEDQRIAKQTLDADLHRRMDFHNTLTLRTDEWVITGKSAETTEWDTDQLQSALSALVGAGLISEDAATRALQPVVTLKPSAAELKKLAGKPGPVGDAIRACQHSVPQARRATVKRAI